MSDPAEGEVYGCDPLFDAMTKNIIGRLREAEQRKSWLKSRKELRERCRLLTWSSLASKAARKPKGRG